MGPRPALRQAAGQSFYNTSNFTLRGLLAEPNQLEANFRSFLDGVFPDVQEILDKLEFRNQIPRLAARDLDDGEPHVVAPPRVVGKDPAGP